MGIILTFIFSTLDIYWNQSGNETEFFYGCISPRRGAKGIPRKVLGILLGVMQKVTREWGRGFRNKMTKFDKEGREGTNIPILGVTHFLHGLLQGVS